MANTTWNPSDKAAGITLSGGNLIATNTNNATCLVRAVDKQVSGKFYWECTCNVLTSSLDGVGAAVGHVPTSTIISSNSGGPAGICGLSRGGQVCVDGSAIITGFGTVANGTVVCIAIDCTARLIWFRLGAAGNWNISATANPATGAGGVAITSLGVGFQIYPAANVANTNDQVTANFGDTAFTGTVPAGFTSGFTAGASIPTNEVLTQIAIEQWSDGGTINAQVTQMAIEMWATNATVNPMMIATQLALEQWATVAEAAAAAPRGPMITAIM